MNATKSVLFAFLAGVILASGTTYWIVTPGADVVPVSRQACASLPEASSPVNEYAMPVPTTGGLDPNDLKTVVHPNIPVTSGGSTHPISSDGQDKEH